MKLVALVLVVLGACGGSSGKTIAPGDLDAEFRDAVCAYKARCGSFPDEDSCHRAYVSISFALAASDFAAIDAGKVKYDGKAARTCVDAIAKESCDTTDLDGRSPPEACDHIVTGTLGDGASCVLSSECISQRCAIPICQVACCAGTCDGGTAPTRAKLGDACTNLPCVDGAFCDITAGTCVALHAQGDACSGSYQCDYGLGCIGTPTQCQPLPQIGEPCPDGLCRDDGVTCNASMTCVALGLPGDTCTPGGYDCSPYYTCDSSGHCADKSAQGGPCSSSFDCFDDGTYCAIPSGQTTGSCSPPQANGAPCTDDRDCASDHCEDSVTTPICTDEAVCT